MDKCELCGIPPHYEVHDAYHRLKEWNQGVFKDAKEKAMSKFDKELEDKKKLREKTKWKSLDM